MKTDIIIPVYNAYDYLVACVDSIYEYTDYNEFNLIMINDCSTDMRINEFLGTLENEKKNITILSNKKNLGFVGTINLGIMKTINDVVLLNSDTEVTPNWLKKLKKAAYSHKSFATVTPLTNNGTICSVPIFCEDNAIPESLNSYLEMGEIVEKSSMCSYPAAPTGVGFCMYIKRNILEEIGLFDIEKFRKGYGEENDFCCRCIEHGYKNIIDDQTFIYHKGSMSFSSSKEEYIKNNLKTLGKLYPNYFNSVDEFIRKNPLSSTHETINMNLMLKNGRDNILFILHNDFLIGHNHPCGGTEMHVHDLVEKFKYNTNCFVFSTANKVGILDIFVDNEITTLKFSLKSKIEQVEIYRQDYKQIAESIVKYFNINLIHIHHLKGHTFDIFDIAEEYNINVLYTAHDYYCICQNINLLFKDETYCKDVRSPDKCNECLKWKYGYNDISKVWVDNFYKHLCKCKMIIVPSKAAEILIKEGFDKFNLSSDKLDFEIIEHGEFDTHSKFTSKPANQKFTVCIFGGIIKHKGSEEVYKIIKESNNDIEWFIYGNVYDEKIKSISELNVHLFSSYQHDEIIGILRDCNPDIVLNLPIWPETFSYVLSEAFLAGIPVVGTNLGALSDRIIEGENGWKVQYPINVKWVIEKISELASKRNEISIMKKGLLDKRYKNLSEMSQEHYVLFNKFIINNNIKVLLKDKIQIMSAFDSTYTKENEQDYVAIEDYNKLINHIQEINSSRIWKIFKKSANVITTIKIITKKAIHIFEK